MITWLYVLYIKYEFSIIKYNNRNLVVTCSLLVSQSECCEISTSIEWKYGYSRQVEVGDLPQKCNSVTYGSTLFNLLE